MSSSNQQYLELASFFTLHIKHNQTIGIKPVHADGNSLTLMLPFSQAIVAVEKRRTISGAALTALMDSACGTAVVLALGIVQPCPTLDLRIDYVARLEAEKALYVCATVQKIERDIVFIRGCAYHDDPQQPVAIGIASFLRFPPKEEDIGIFDRLLAQFEEQQ